MRKFSGYRADSVRRKLDPSISQIRRKRLRKFGVGMLILVMSAIVYVICFLGKPPIVPDIVRNKAAQVHLVSPFDFSYESEFQTEAKRKLASERIPPLYKISPTQLGVAEKNLNTLLEFFAVNQGDFDEVRDNDKDVGQLCERLSAALRKSTQLAVSPEDIKAVYDYTTAENRRRIFNHAFFHAKSILNDGVYSDGDSIFSARSDLYNIDIGGSREKAGRIQSQTDARKMFLTRVRSIGLNDKLGYAVYRILNQDLLPNIEFDELKTLELRRSAAAKVKPVVVKVREGETIIDSTSAGDSPLVLEKLKAYKKVILERRDTVFSNSNFYLEFGASFLLILTAALFIRISKTMRNRQPRTIAAFCVLLLINLLVVRLIIYLGYAEYFDKNTTFLQIFKYGTFLMLSPIIQVLLFGPYTGFVMALLITALTSMMLGGNLFFFILSFTSSLVAIYFCNGATSRSRVVLAGVIYGLVVSFFSVVLGASAEVPLGIMWRQALAALVGGALTSFVAMALLPIIERMFNRYSNITLIDFTDFNNPLLRRLQIEAPGTYHHSVMVSYLAEHAAVMVGANEMVCRVGAYYHDIGKIVKPEFFSENQGGGRNPHDDQTPSMSALIIKSHIKEGIALAKIEKMPQQIIDAIAQHHGTSIISYFYTKAVKLAREAGREISGDPVELLRQAGIEESTYRHEGRKPQTVENAIIMLADSCEAASRSLKKITQHGVEELVGNIIRAKMNDGQLNECPITIKQLSRIKSSFVFTMLNMLHSRVEYQKTPQK